MILEMMLYYFKTNNEVLLNPKMENIEQEWYIIIL
jgi:hypothetical protein